MVTVNDYLATRDAEWMGQIHRFLASRRAGVADDRRLAGQEGRLRLRHHLRHQQRVRLRLPARQHGPLARRHGPARPPLRHRRRGRLHPDRRGPHPAHHLRPGRRGRALYYRVRRASRRCWSRTPTTRSTRRSAPSAPTEPGVENVESRSASTTSTTGPANSRPPADLKALKAKELYQRDKDYIVARRRGADRRRVHRPRAGGPALSDGLHQAIEAKENVPIKEENQTLATITLQNYFRLYDKLAGHDRHRRDRGRRVREIYKIASCRSRPTCRWSARTRPT